MQPSMTLKSLALVLVALAASASSLSAATVLKSPNLGSFWQPLSQPGGTYVYANSFVAPTTGTVTDLGMWLNTFNEDPATDVRFQVWGSVGGNAANGPDYNNVLATTPALNSFSGPLAFYGTTTSSSSTLTAGQTYWFAATVVGSAGSATYQVGGHTQNSVYNDNGTFWYSNDPLGHSFDGVALTPEMAFRVDMNGAGPVPDNGQNALMLAFPVLALFGLGLRRHSHQV